MALFNDNRGFSGNTYNNNSRFSSVSATTRLKTFYGTLSQLTLSYWNDKLSIKMNPVSGRTAEGLLQYDFNKKFNSAISVDKATALAKQIKEVIIPEMNKYKEKGEFDKPVSVSVTTSASVKIGVEYKMDGDKPYAFLIGYSGVNEQGVAPADGIYTYRFEKIEIEKNYDAATGTSEKVLEDSEFDFFYEKLSSLSSVIGNASHSITYDKALQSSYAPQQTGYQNQQQAPANTYQAPVSNFNPDELPFN